MQTTTVRQNICEIVISIVGDREQDLRDETQFLEDLGCDHLDMQQVFSQVEGASEVQITDAEALQVKTVGQLIELVDLKVNP